jgi:hypothetical protein
MNVQQIKDAHNHRPFKPFTIRTALGEHYPVKRPESLWQSPGGRTIVVATGGERVVMIDLAHITEFVYDRV